MMESAGKKLTVPMGILALSLSESNERAQTLWIDLFSHILWLHAPFGHGAPVRQANMKPKSQATSSKSRGTGAHRKHSTGKCPGVQTLSSLLAAVSPSNAPDGRAMPPCEFASHIKNHTSDAVVCTHTKFVCMLPCHPASIFNHTYQDLVQLKKEGRSVGCRWGVRRSQGRSQH